MFFLHHIHATICIPDDGHSDGSGVGWSVLGAGGSGECNLIYGYQNCNFRCFSCVTNSYPFCQKDETGNITLNLQEYRLENPWIT